MQTTMIPQCMPDDDATVSSCVEHTSTSFHRRKPSELRSCRETSVEGDIRYEVSTQAAHGPDHSILEKKTRRSINLLELSMMAIEYTISLSRALVVP